MLVFNGLCALVDVAIPLFQRYAIRNFIQADSLRGIVPFSLVYLLVILLQALSVVAFARNSMTIEMNMGRDMRRTLFHHSYHYPFRCDLNLPENPADPCRAVAGPLSGYGENNGASRPYF